MPFLKDPGYAKVQIGVYIAALEDTMARVSLDNDDAEMLGPSTRSTTSNKSANTLQPVAKRATTKWRRSRPKRRKRILNDLQVSDSIVTGTAFNQADFQWSIQQAITRSIVLLHIRYDIYHTIQPHIFHRGQLVDLDDDIPELQIPEVLPIRDEDRLMLFLNSELGEGNTGVVHGGVLEIVSVKRHCRMEVAAKLSFSDAQIERLRDEWEMHEHLMSSGVKGIPALLGGFYDPNSNSTPLCLLMNYAGVSLQRSGVTITSVQR